MSGSMLEPSGIFMIDEKTRRRGRSITWAMWRPGDPATHRAGDPAI
jgi:hypothetical protein